MLQASLSSLTAAEEGDDIVVHMQVNEQLRKRIYSFEEREARKRNRNDVKQ